MRIAYVCADLGVPVFGTKGCSIHVQEVVRGLVQQGHEVHLFAARVGGSCPAALEDVVLHHLAVAESQSGEGRETAARDLATQIELRLHQCGSFDLVYERYSLWSSAGCDYATAAGIPCILEVNAPLIDEQESHRGLHDREAAIGIARHAFETASSVVVVSEAVKQHVLQLAPRQANAHVICNGVDVDRFTPERKPRNAADSCFRIGFVGTLKPWHGVELLFEAFRQLAIDTPGAELIIVGDGPMRTELCERYCGDASDLAQRVQWTGSITPGEIPQQLRGFDVGVAPYPHLENFYFSPLKIFEYMACGLPVVASNAGQIRELVEHGQTGLLVQPGNAEELTAALKRLYADPALRFQLGGAAREKAVQEFSWERVLTQALETLSASRHEPLAASRMNG